MDALMQALFNDITDRLLEKYYAQMAELEAMFLASFDQCKALALPHC